MQNPAVRPSVTCPPEIKLEAEKFEKHTAAAENISLNSELLPLRARNATRSTAFGVISPRQTSGLSQLSRRSTRKTTTHVFASSSAQMRTPW